MRLGLLSEARLPAVDAMLTDPEILHHTRIPEPAPPGFASEWLDRYEEMRSLGTGEIWDALDDDGTFLGVGMAIGIDREGRELELGYIVAPEARGRGVATEILERLTQWAFDKLGALRITLLIDVDNPASFVVAERVGYVREGVMRSLHLKQERRGGRDHVEAAQRPVAGGRASAGLCLSPRQPIRAWRGRSRCPSRSGWSGS